MSALPDDPLPDDPEAEEDDERTQPADDDDDAAGGEPPAAAAPQPPPLTEKQLERRQRDLEKEADRHRDRVAAIMGDDFALLVPCPLDFTPGFIFNPAMVPLPPDVVQAARELAGMGAPPALRMTDDEQECDRCDGYGILLRPTKVESQRTKPCAGCNGSGVKPKLQPPPPPPAPLVPLGAVPAGTGTTVLDPYADKWGRPPAHPHYGQDPATIGV